jgi:NAD(P)H-dependent FMN reductase
MTKILFFAGSAREGSLNKKLAKQAAALAEEMGAETTFLDLKDYPMPIYCEGIEADEGVPENAQTLKDILIDHDGVFVASPEYNSSFSPLLKNVIDWVSRVRGEGEPMLPAYKGKVYALGAASPGGFGGLRGLVPLRMMLGNIGIHVTPTQIAISKASDVFDEQDQLTDERQMKLLKAVVSELVETAKARKAA